VGRVAAAHSDRGRGLFNDLKVVHELSSLVIVAGSKVFLLPELVLRLWAAPLPCEIFALDSKAFR
jgi:hypothetical protein